MKKFFIIALFVVAFFQINEFNVANAGSTLTVINNTNQTIYQLYCSTSKSNYASDWGKERLGDSVLNPGESFVIRTAPVTTHRYVNLLFGVYIRGKLNFKIIEDIDLNKISRVDLGGNFK